MRYDLVHLNVTTRHFSFDAYGRTLAEAQAALKKGWEKHVEETKAVLRYAELEPQVNIVRFGDCVRDDSILTRLS